MFLQGNMGRYLYRASSAFACLLILCSFLSCEKPPVEPIIHAEKALQEAHNNKARIYAAVPYEKADKALIQSRNFVKVKKYKEAAESAALATRYARQSIDLVPAGREEYKSQSTAALTGMEEKLGELRQRIENTRNKRTKKKMEGLCKPFIAKWDLQLRSLREQLEKEEPYDVFNVIEKNRKLFMDEFSDIDASLNRKKAKP